MVRAVVVYVFLIVLLRITGKRQVGQLAPFDLVLLLVLSNAVQNSMNADDNLQGPLPRVAASCSTARRRPAPGPCAR